MKKGNAQVSPLTFDVSEPMFDKMKTLASQAELGSISVIIRTAIENFDFDSYESDGISHKQISVRLPAEIRDELRRVSKEKKVSVGELIRAALAVLNTRQGKAILKAAKDKDPAAKKAASKKAVAKEAAPKKLEKKGGKKSNKKKNKTKKK